ncbi:phosphomannomutase [Aethina tumida]|uniref:phosphomannomutase n=1 Tax=Aethina tumida TaxID=116153 RepID=UPI00096B1702|nr:phosphomannomutase [Aethina tumida]
MILCLFDVDGTLTKPRLPVEPDFEKFLYDEVKPRCALGLVGGSDFKKIAEQMNGVDVVNKFDYVFSENGLVWYKKGVLQKSFNIQKHMGEEILQKFINFTLKYLSGITLPVKRGTFVEFRTGLINVSPIGRSCSQSERDAFEQYDKQHKIRETMIEALKKEFPDIGLTYSIGGQISFDVFPNGWDKTYCLQHLESEGFTEIHFFGDKTAKGGNDYEIYMDPRTIGHSVKNPSETKEQLKQLLKL